MKSILLSIKPKYVSMILNKVKTIEIRKRFPSDYVGWVYIYCCKQRKNEIGCHINYEKVDGKVVARFWCDNVEPAYKFYVEELCQFACITKEELYKYAGGWYKTDDLLAIHITKLEIFDRPKEISEFKPHCNYPTNRRLNRAPQSWCYVEI